MSDELPLIAPLAVPLAAAGLALLARGRRGRQRVLSAAALAVVVLAGGWLTRRSLADGVVHTVIGDDRALTGIALTADPLGAALVTATGLLAAVALATMATVDDDGHPLLHPLMLLLLAGVCGTFVAGDLFTVFVLFEIALVASAVVLVLDGSRRQLRAVALYLSVNLIGTLVLLAGIADVLATAGTVNLALLAEQAAEDGRVTTGMVMVGSAFALKAGLLPFSGWLVVAYPAARRTAAALFAGTLTTVGVAALYRVGLLAFGAAAPLRLGILVAAAATLLVTALAAVATDDVGRMLALLVLTQVGFMAVGFGLGTRAGVTAGVFFILQDVLVKTATLLAARPLEAAAAAGRVARGSAVAVLVVLTLSLVGVPPLAGFVGKALLLEAALDAGAAPVAAAGLAASLLLLAAAVRLWRLGGSWTGPLRPSDDLHRAGVRRVAPIVPGALVAVATLVVGIVPGGLLAVADAAADTLTDPAGYAEEVLEP